MYAMQFVDPLYLTYVIPHPNEQQLVCIYLHLLYCLANRRLRCSRVSLAVVGVASGALTGAVVGGLT